MRKNWYNYLATIVVIVVGVTFLYATTNGFQAFTKESARAYVLSKEKPMLPEFTLEDSKKREFPFSDYSGNYVLITFIYTNCSTACPQLETNFSDVYNRIPQKYFESDLDFLTISFDPDNDDPTTLENYRHYFGSDGETWRMARINDKDKMNELLDLLEVVVIPDGEGDFSHNVAFYLINPSGHLEDILDYQKVDVAAERVEALVANKVSEDK